MPFAQNLTIEQVSRDRETVVMKDTRETWKPLANEISKLVDRIHRLGPDHRNPHRFHEEKSEIAYDLSELARQVN